MIGNHVLPDISRFEIWLFSLFELEAQTEMGVLELQQMTQRVISSRLTSKLLVQVGRKNGFNCLYRGFVGCFELY